MITLNAELYGVTNNISSRITRIYEGIIIPDTGIHYINTLSPASDLQCAVLYTYWKILERNSYNPKFRAMIISTNYKSYDKLIEKIKISNLANFYEPDKVNVITDIKDISDNKKSKHKSKKNNIPDPVVLVLDSNKKKLEDIFLEFKPDLVLLEDVFKMKENCKAYQLIQKLCMEKSNFTDHDTATVSFSYMTPAEIIVQTKFEKNSVTFETNSFYDEMQEKNLDLDLKLINDQDPNDSDKFLSLLNRSLAKCSLKKVLVICSSHDEVKNLYKAYKKSYLSTKDKKFKYPCLIGVSPYDGTKDSDITEYCALYNHSELRKFMSVFDYKNLIDQALKNGTESGILFVESSKAQNLYVKNIDSLLILDTNYYKNDLAYLRAIRKLSSVSRKDIKVVFIETIGSIYKNLYRISELVTDPSLDNVHRYYDLIKKISRKELSLDVDLTSVHKKKLEKLFGITQQDKEYYNRTNILYVATISDNCKTVNDQNYQVEKNYLCTDYDMKTLKTQCSEIVSGSSSDYGGPKWLGRPDCIEIPGNKIGFANEETDQIEICEILEVKKFDRKNKRPTWKETKDNRQRNILFLSPVIDKLQLSKFKKKIKHSQHKKIEYMLECEIPKKLRNY